MFDRVKGTIDSLLGREPDRVAQAISPVHPRVLMIVHDPPVASEGNRRLTEIFSWHNPAKLAQGYIDDLRDCSGGYLNYQIVERIDAGWYPPKEDGFRYTDETFLAAWRSQKHRQPERIDYLAQIEAFQLQHRHRMGEFDEVWFFRSRLPGITNRLWPVPGPSGATPHPSRAPSALPRAS